MADTDETYSMVLTHRDLLTIRFALRQMDNKLVRNMRKNPFIPEPGHVNVSQLKHERMQAILSAIDVLMCGNNVNVS